MFGQVMSDGVLSWLASFSWKDVMALPLSSAQIHMHKKKTYTTTHLLSTSSSFWMGRRLKRAQNSASSTFRLHDQNSEQNWEFFKWRILKYI